MATVTIGVPVFNGAETLRECLQCLRDQTYRDIEILIGDNCSTDNSVEIAQAFVEADPRFKLIRRPEDIGAKLNFTSLVGEATSELFIWRADDDLSDANFVECLKARWDEDVSTDLVAPRIVSQDSDGTILWDASFPAVASKTRAGRIGEMLSRANVSWVYGLWNRERLFEILERTGPGYPYLWAWDPLTIFPALLDEGVLGCDETRLVKRKFSSRCSSRTSAANMFAMRRAFRVTCFQEFNRRRWSLAERLFLMVYVYRYANKRVYRFFKAFRCFYREKLGLLR